MMVCLFINLLIDLKRSYICSLTSKQQVYLINTSIIELAVKVKDGEIIDKFERFSNPHEKLSETIINLTHITDDMLVDAPEIEEVLTEFKGMGRRCHFVAHNASFDMGFIDTGYERLGFGSIN